MLLQLPKYWSQSDWLLIDWVKGLSVTEHNTGLDLELKKLNLTQQKQTTKERNGKNTQKANLNLNKTETKSQL